MSSSVDKNTRPLPHERYVSYMDEQSRERYYRQKAAQKEADRQAKIEKMQAYLPTAEELLPYTQRYVSPLQYYNEQMQSAADPILKEV